MFSNKFQKSCHKDLKNKYDIIGICVVGMDVQIIHMVFIISMMRNLSSHEIMWLRSRIFFDFRCIFNKFVLNLKIIFFFLHAFLSIYLEWKGGQYGMVDEHASVEYRHMIYLDYGCTNGWFWTTCVFNNFLSQVGPYSQGESLQFMGP